jgi:phage pi2 protein 07
MKMSDKEEDNLLMDTMLNQPKAGLQTINYAIFSMIASSAEGAEYLMRYKNFLPRVFKTLKQSEKDTVLNRFALAVIQKMSSLEQGAVYLLENKFSQWGVEYLEEMDPVKEHSFMPIYILSAIYNVLLADANQPNILMDISQYAKVLKRIVKLIANELPGACYLSILEILKAFNRQNPRWTDMDLEAKVTSTLKDFLSDFENIFKGEFSFLSVA